MQLNDSARSATWGKAEGCSHFQGFLLGRPVSHDDSAADAALAQAGGGPAQ
jgi:EAL domain-containing protein (putative c-di-GMP-specific phosphodiesterase class I)